MKEYGMTIFEEMYQGLSRSERKEYLDKIYVKRFLDQLNGLSPHLGDSVLNAYMNGALPDNWEEIRREVINLGGVIGPILERDPGDARFMNLLYRYTFPQGPLDQFLMNCDSGRAVNYRKTAVIKNTTPVIKAMMSDRPDNRITVLNLGSGYGYDSLEMSRQYADIAACANFINIDICRKAIEEGIDLLKKNEYKVFSGVSFHRQNMLKVSVKNADMSWIIGVLCGFPHNACIDHIKCTAKMMRKGGIIYGACVTDEMIKKDFFTCFVLQQILHWPLCYRRQEDVARMFEDADLRWRRDLSFKEDNTFYYVIGAGEVV